MGLKIDLGKKSKIYPCLYENCDKEFKSRSGRSKHHKLKHGQDSTGQGSSASALPEQMTVRVRDPNGARFEGVIRRAPRNESTRLIPEGEPSGETLSSFSEGSSADDALDPDWDPRTN